MGYYPASNQFFGAVKAAPVDTLHTAAAQIGADGQLYTQPLAGSAGELAANKVSVLNPASGDPTVQYPNIAAVKTWLGNGYNSYSNGDWTLTLPSVLSEVYIDTFESNGLVNVYQEFQTGDGETATIPANTAFATLVNQSLLPSWIPSTSGTSRMRIVPCYVVPSGLGSATFTPFMFEVQAWGVCSDSGVKSLQLMVNPAVTIPANADMSFSFDFMRANLPS
jgi:hypothetical protein